MSFKTLYQQSPPELKQIVMDQWKAKQNPKWHPEGNTLKHIIVVTNRAFRDFPDNKDIQLAAYFHDLGKLATYEINPKSGQPTAYGHEEESVTLIDQFKDFIEKQGANPEIVKYIVKNHMKIKPSTWDVMKPSKKDPIINDPNYQELEKFGTIDKGGLLEMQYLLKNKYNMKKQLNEEFRRMQKLAGIQINENLEYYHNGADGNQIITYDDKDITNDLEFLGQGSMDGQDFQPGETYNIGGKDYKVEKQGDNFKLSLAEGLLNKAEDIFKNVDKVLNRHRRLLKEDEAKKSKVYDFLYSDEIQQYTGEIGRAHV